ncbi:MAG TPA: 3-deoxy-D-manno-octulosonic acid transferase, partial [Blastocatellia bacterium]|nr:3-deoxy-D-manno-octulosonic acid transferase [Blastocatellia bacterium]
KKRLPDYRIVISTTTVTGQAIAKERFGPESVFHFPFDFGWIVRRTLSIAQPQMIIMMESELWPRFLYECKRRRIPVIVANGRMSDRSFRGYQRARVWTKRMLDNISLWLMQSAADAERIVALGIPADSVKNLGNLKYDLSAGDESKRERIATNLAEHFGLDNIKHLIIAGSTTEGEEPIILEGFKKVRQTKGLEQTRLMIVPRHPERFDEVARLIKHAGFSLARRSEASVQNADVLLLDTIGELAAAFRFATVVFIGGSLVPKGGHNILEPAAYAKPIIVGPYMENFRQVMADFTTRNAVVQLPKLEGPALGEALAATVTELIFNEQASRQLGERAQAVILENRGAAERYAEEIAKRLCSRSETQS